MHRHPLELEDLARLHVAELRRAALRSNLVRQPPPLAAVRRATARALIAAGTALGGHDPRHGPGSAVLPAPLPRATLPAGPS